MVDLLSIVASVVISVCASVIAVEYRVRRIDRAESSREVEEWYSESARMGQTVRDCWRRKFVRPSDQNSATNYDEVQREMNLFSDQLSNHASQATSLDVDDDVVEALNKVSEVCRDIHDIHVHLNSHSEFEELGEDLIDATEHLEEVALEQV